MDDEEIWKRLQTINEMASTKAILATIETLTHEIGHGSIDGISIQEFFARERAGLVEHLISSYADADPDNAAELKRMLDKLNRQRE